MNGAERRDTMQTTTSGNIVIIRREISPSTFICLQEIADDGSYVVTKDTPAPSLLGGQAWLASARRGHETLRAAIIDMAERCGVAPATLAWELGDGAPKF